jgi:hypothetical protein
MDVVKKHVDLVDAANVKYIAALDNVGVIDKPSN